MPSDWLIFISIWYHTVRTQNGLNPYGSLFRLLYVDSDECVFCVLGPLLSHVMLMALTFTLLVCAHIEIQSNIVVVFLQSNWLCIGIVPWYSLYLSHLFYTVLWYISTGIITVQLLSIFVLHIFIDLWHNSLSHNINCKLVCFYIIFIIQVHLHLMLKWCVSYIVLCYTIILLHV